MDPIFWMLIGVFAGGALTWLYCKIQRDRLLAEVRLRIQGELATLQEKASQRSVELEETRKRAAELESRLGEWQIQLMQEKEGRAAAAALAERLPELQAKITAQENDLGVLQGQISNDRSRIRELETLLDNEKKNAAEKLALLSEAATQLKEAFNSLSADALKSNNQAFLTLARTTLERYQSDARQDLEQRQKAVEGLITPVRETLEKYDKQIQAIEGSRQEAYGRLTEQVQSLFNSQQQLQRETGNLVKALRTPHVRGRWGEFTLRRVVEVAGMSPYCDFEEQIQVETETGRQRPDMVVRLPGGKILVVDSKVPLHAYLESLEAADDEQKRNCLESHVRHIRTHLQKLSSKSYWEQFETTPEFVIMFIPGEAFYSAAVELAPQLFEEGVNQRVIIATPSNLIPLLLTVGYGWRQEAITSNAQKIKELGNMLYDRVATLVNYFADMGSSLDKCVSTYNKLVGSMESRVLVTVRKFKELGATAKEELPELEVIDTVPRSLQTAERQALPDNSDSPE